MNKTQDFRAFLRERFIDEYRKAESMTEAERAARIKSVDCMVDMFLRYADMTGITMTEDGLVFASNTAEELKE